jgi:type I restriction enzyme S subunit
VPEDEFILYSIKDVGTVITGSTPSTSDKTAWVDEIPFLTPTDIDDFDYVVNPVRRVSGESSKNYHSRIVQQESVGVVCIGATIGKLARINTPTLTNQQINSIVPNLEILDRDYLFYLLILYEPYLKRLAGGSATPLLVKSDFENISLRLPSLSRQKKVSSILRDFDELIYGYSNVVDHLKNLCTSIFEYWFVQYDFPNDQGNPYSASGGELTLDEGSEISIPFGWGISKLSSHIDVVSGYSFNSKDYREDGKYGVVTIGNVKDGFLDIAKQNRIDIDLDLVPEHCLLREKDILVSLTGNVGRVAFVHEERQLLNQRVGKLDPQQNFANYAYLYLSRPEIKKRLENIANGSSQDNLSPNDLFADFTAIPPETVLVKFNQLVDPLVEQIIQIQKQINNLSKLKAFYLPLLIDGKLTW